ARRRREPSRRPSRPPQPPRRTARDAGWWTAHPHVWSRRFPLRYRALERIDDRLGVRGGGASRRLVPLAHPPNPLRGGAGWGFKIQKSPPAGPSPGGGRGLVGAGVGGAGWGSGWSGRWCALSSVGPRRQSGTCREVKRRLFPLVWCLFAPPDLPAEP